MLGVPELLNLPLPLPGLKLSDNKDLPLFLGELESVRDKIEKYLLQSLLIEDDFQPLLV